MSCAASECPSDGQWSPILVMRRLVKTPPTRASFGQKTFCLAHREQVRVEHLLSSEGWDKMMKSLREAGRGTFRKNLTTLEWSEEKCLT